VEKLSAGQGARYADRETARRNVRQHGGQRKKQNHAGCRFSRATRRAGSDAHGKWKKGGWPGRQTDGDPWEHTGASRSCVPRGRNQGAGGRASCRKEVDAGRHDGKDALAQVMAELSMREAALPLPVRSGGHVPELAPLGSRAVRAGAPVPGAAGADGTEFVAWLTGLGRIR